MKMKRTNKDVADGRFPRLLVGQEVLVCLETGKPNRHLGHDSRKDSTEALIERQRRLSLYNLDACCDEPSWFRLSPCGVRTKGGKEATPCQLSECDEMVWLNTYPGQSTRTRKLHSHFDCVERLAA